MSVSTDGSTVIIDLRDGEPVIDLTGGPERFPLGLTPTQSPPPSAYGARVKPVLDRVIAVTLLVALAPLFAVVAALVAVSLGRPILFRQTRVGEGGREFTMLKFRTMRPDDGTEARQSVTDRLARHKRADDPRITRIGRVLRATSLDELPQLVNVLRGEMSIVGPRPELPWIVETYSPLARRRHEVRPGMTGLWQVSARRRGAMHEAVDIDLDYVARQSLGLDAAILLRTPLAALKGR